MLQRMMMNNQQNYNNVRTNYQKDIQNQEIDDISDFFDMIKSKKSRSSKYTTTLKQTCKIKYRIEQKLRV